MNPDDFFSKLYGGDGRNEPFRADAQPVQDEPEAAPVVEEVPATPADDLIISGKQEVGSIIEYKGRTWLVTHIEREDGVAPADIRDEMDEVLPRGWHSWLVEVQPGNKALPVLVELIDQDEAAITFTDTAMYRDGEYAFIRDLAYTSELGLYDRSKLHV